MHHTETFNPAIYASRRQRVAQRMQPGSIALIPTAIEAIRNRDSHFPYRPDSYFYYLTGFTEPNAWLVLTAEGHSTLLCQPKDLQREIWDGYRLGPEAAIATLGVQDADSFDHLMQRLPRLLENTTAVYYPFATHTGMAQQVEQLLEKVRARARFGANTPTAQLDLCAILDEMRLIKDAHEIDTMRRAGIISAQAHVRAMQRSAHMLATGQDTREYHLEAELLYIFREHGAQAPAYNSIVAAGHNACVLHYRASDAPVRAGDLVLIDAACELDGYASDITRTFPANGRFTAAQRDLYDVVLASEEAAIAATKPGARFNDPHDAAVRILTQGMLDFGLLNANRVGTLDDAIAQRAYFPFYMHRTSHWLGMDVHDCGSYNEPTESGQMQERQDPLSGETIRNRPSRILAPGMMLTIEPGLYVRPGPDIPEAFHHIGIRIEDNALVTETGNELLTRDVPVKADAIENLMRV
ncbi:M24 family metallopeptidase [Lampropedia puyangensis]|uniref:Xaa-Pro aminopeptidase n=1 Tax=Lampropedia puyangensis TaxID=1330072 RepID=A0A4S8FA13_9BURK|nr:aminopeptidase P N-terminal domain-containing protein [Lampropedia puyangensis]THU03675.1 M24 family metallopeptidase [Lampropedia puyangensis]